MKRLEYGILADTDCGVEMFVADDGDYVLYEEAQAEIDEAWSILYFLNDKFLFREDTPADLIQRIEAFLTKHKGE